jgi:hypothetical protein
MSATWTIPYQRNPLFTGQEEIFKRIQTDRADRGMLGFPGAALLGPAGIGKTAIAIEYVYRFGDTYQAVFWKDTSKERERRDLASLIARLQASPGWLLVVDQLADLALMKQIIPLVNEASNLLVTARQPVPGLLRIMVPPLSDEEAALGLLRYQGALGPEETLEQTSSTTQGYALALARLLQGVPGALEQAAQEINSSQVSLRDYSGTVYQRRYGMPPLQAITIAKIQEGQQVVYFEGDYPEIYVGRIKAVCSYALGEAMEGDSIVLADVTLLLADNYRSLEYTFYRTYLQDKVVVPPPEVLYRWPENLPAQTFDKPKWPGHEINIRLKLKSSRLIQDWREHFGQE